MSTATRRDALQVWESSLENLGQALSVYNDTTTGLFAHFDTDSRSTQPDDLSAEDALQRIDMRLSRIEQLEMELHNMRDDEDRAIIEERQALEEEKDEDTFDDSILPDPPHFPTLVSHVCRRWRQIAMDTPMFWTGINFREGHPYDRAKAWLARSQDCQLEVTFDVFEDGSQFMDNESYVIAAAQILQPHASRISRLLISMTALDEMVSIVGRLIAGGQIMPLKALALLVEEADGDLIVREDIRARAGTLKTILEGLEEFEIEKVCLPWDQISFHGLKSLKLRSLLPPEGPSYKQLHALLSSSPNLEIFQFYGVELEEEGFNPKELSQIGLPNLHSLTLELLEHGPTWFACHVISAPNLAHLKFEDFEIAYPRNSNRSHREGSKWLSAFFDRIGPTSLRTLRLSQDVLNDQDYMAALSSARGLEELNLGENDSINDIFLDWVTGKGEDVASILPNLKTLKIDNCTNVTLSSLKRLVESRHAAGKPLRSLSIKYCRLEEGADEWLRERITNVTVEEDSDTGTDSSEEDDLDMEPDF
ncbi:hypothetical protein FRB90_008330, partial [Tulasnella sp. 427]